MANSVNPDPTAPIGAVCSGSTLFISILISSVMLGNYLLQTTSVDNISELILGCGSVIITLFLHYWPKISSSLRSYFRTMS